MKKILTLLFLIIIIFQISSCQTNETQNNKSSTNESQVAENKNNNKVQGDNEKFIETVQFLEENPLDEKAKEKGRWALKYSENIKTPNCDTITKLFLTMEVRGEVITQFIIKKASFELENSEKKYDINDAQVAALESAAKVYEKIIKAEPSAKSERFDNLLDLKNKNQLADFVKDAKCKEQK